MRRFFLALKEEQTYITMVALVFLVSAISGYANAEELSKTGILKQLEEVAKQINQNPSFFNTFSTILLNNILVALSMVFFGLLFGIIPLGYMLMNGMVLGVVLVNASTKAGIHPLLLLITTILPHGFLEIPAAIFASALGLRLGVTVLRSFLALFSSRLRETIIHEWTGIRQRLPVLLLGVSVLLIVAAMIEASLIVLMKPM